MQKYNEMVDSGFKWLGAVPSEWAIMRGKFLYINKKELNRGMVESQRLALTLRGVIERYDGDSVGLNPESLESYQIFEKNDLVFKLIDLENKQTSRVGLTPKRGIMSPAYIRLTPKVRVSAKYFYYFYYSLYLTYVFNNIAGEGVRANLSAKELLELPVPVPAPEYQQKIADFLDQETAKIDNLIAKQERLLELLEEKRRATITHAVTRGLNPNVELKETNIPWLGQINVNHEVLPLKNMVRYQEGPGIMAADFHESGVPLIRISGLREDGVICNGKNFLSPEKVEKKWSHFRLEPHDLLISASASTGVISEVRPNSEAVGAVAYTGIIRFQVKNSKRLSKDYLKYFVQSQPYLEQIQLSITGSAMQHYGPSHLGQFKIVLPSPDEQELIVSRLDTEMAKAKKLKQKIQTQITLLRERRTSLISHAVTGKVKV